VRAWTLRQRSDDLITGPVVKVKVCSGGRGDSGRDTIGVNGKGMRRGIPQDFTK